MTNDLANRRYLDWLIGQTEFPDEYESLLEQIHKYEFVWIVPNDDNRVEDAKEIRFEYLRSRDEIDLHGLIPYISVLEVLIALSRRCEFQTGQASQEWMTTFIRHLGLEKFRGHLGIRRQNQVATIIDDFIWRRYTHHGEGGLFPLKYPKEDQTKVELWYQMHAYLIENNC
jgi:hypothetical protein